MMTPKTWLFRLTASSSARIQRCLYIPVLAIVFALIFAAPHVHAEFKAGAAIVDVTPEKLPVIVNGGMTSRSIEKIKTKVFARAIVMADQQSQVAIVVVDSCMIGRALLDDIKSLARIKTGIPTDRILISATHAHSAPSAMACLGTDADENYLPLLRERIVSAIAEAQKRLQPAEIGFGRTDAPEFTALRQWIRRPDKIDLDPFGNPTVRANMHAGADWNVAVGEAGPEDPELSLIGIRSRDGRPLAVLANFSMHYFGDSDISSDYFGLFCNGFATRLGFDPSKDDFVGIMSHGCSGDIWRRDYTRPDAWDPNLSIERYAEGLLDLAVPVWKSMQFASDASIAMAETRLPMRYRVPNKQTLEWAQRVVDAMGNRLPKDTSEVYAREQIYLHEMQQTEVVVQALKIGDIAIATTPNETYAITGLKIKAASPLTQTMVIELANGGDGYIPPTEQHAFGGYNTWPARSAGLEVTAEPRICQAAISLLEQVTSKPRRPWEIPMGPASMAIQKSEPLAWYRLNEFTGPIAADSSSNHRNAFFEPGVTFYLEGAESTKFCGDIAINRAPHFVGGRLRSRINDLTDRYSISMWIWNGMPNDGREFTGWFYSRDHDSGLSQFGEHLGIGGTTGATGRLVFQSGNGASLDHAGKTIIPRWTWSHVRFERTGDRVQIFLNDQLEIETKSPLPTTSELTFGGRSDNAFNWEGRLDEIVIHRR